MKIAAALLSSYVMAQDLMIVEPETQLAVDWNQEDFEPQEVNIAIPTTTKAKQAFFWANTDMLFGAMVGLYEPINRFVRDDDCYSLFFSLSTNLIKYNRFFKSIDYYTNMEWFGLGSSLL